MKPLHRLLASALLATAACDDVTAIKVDNGATAITGGLTVVVTDKPFAYDLVESALVRVDQIRIHKDATGSSGFQTIYSGPALEFDLFDLTNGVTEFLADAQIPVGSYHQLRLHVIGGRLELIDGDVFSTALGNLELTSTDTSGLKVFIDPPIEIVNQASSTLLIDFDLAKTFQAVPGNDPLNATQFMLKPVVHAVNLSLTGEVRGVVEASNGAGGFLSVAKASVYLQPFGDPDPANSLAATASAADGSYALIGVPPGTWNVLAVKDSQQGTVSGIKVYKGNVSFADPVIQ